MFEIFLTSIPQKLPHIDLMTYTQESEGVRRYNTMKSFIPMLNDFPRSQAATYDVKLHKLARMCSHIKWKICTYNLMAIWKVKDFVRSQAVTYTIKI